MSFFFAVEGCKRLMKTLDSKTIQTLSRLPLPIPTSLPPLDMLYPHPFHQTGRRIYLSKQNVFVGNFQSRACPSVGTCWTSTFGLTHPVMQIMSWINIAIIRRTLGVRMRSKVQEGWPFDLTAHGGVASFIVQLACLLQCLKLLPCKLDFAPHLYSWAKLKLHLLV